MSTEGGPFRPRRAYAGPAGLNVARPRCAMCPCPVPARSHHSPCGAAVIGQGGAVPPARDALGKAFRSLGPTAGFALSLGRSGRDALRMCPGSGLRGHAADAAIFVPPGLATGPPGSLEINHQGGYPL